tara:strand:+ start:570 stop:749 length:180 start_codon:yes stop_codon:yes gene_type:complete
MIASEINASEALEAEGIENIWDIAFSSVVPACCSHGCQVEPDGHCSHGFESVLLAKGLI